MSFDPVSILIVFAILLFSLTIHEASHAAMGAYCGDDTARLQGRLTLNPIAHIDPLGTVIVPLVMLMMTGFVFGWAKPVPFNPNRLNNIHLDPVKIAVAGPLSNLAIAIMTLAVARTVILASGGIDTVSPMVLKFFFLMVLLNFILLLFNLIPVPPLDGHYVLNYFLPPAGREFMQKIGPMGIFIAIIVAQPLFRKVLPILSDFIWTVFGA